MHFDNNAARELGQLIEQRKAVIGVLGMGYVGLPLAISLARAGFDVLGFDVDAPRMAALNRGESYLKHIPSAELKGSVEAGKLKGTTDFGMCGMADVLIIAVPTPLTKHREPDLKYVVQTAQAVKATLRRGQLVILESTTYPGTTTEVVKPILESSGLKASRDFFLAFSPEREDPGNPNFSTRTIPKVVGGDGPEALSLASAVYSGAIDKVVPVSSTETAEAVKLTENIFRAVNIALVNELKVVFQRMGIDVWEVIEAANSKPFGFMAFYPGPGIGGHCIPIDPFYLTWKAREYDFHTEFIELAGKINSQMPYFCISKVARALNEHEKALKGANVLVIGVAYKADVNDMRESPALKVISLLMERGAHVTYHDPHVAELEPGHGLDVAMKSVPLTDRALEEADAVVVVTAHSGIDWQHVADTASLVVDFRNAVPRGENVWTL